LTPLLSLAFSVHSNEGVYALLLGSGVSRSSGIPTGWEVVLDLIRKVAALERENCEPAPEVWYREKYKVEPDYRQLLDTLAKSPSERQQLLRGYFEPTEEERAEGNKLPTPAHKAIADLVAGGYIRVIITTNFDRLTEMSLEAVGIFPTVISTTDQLIGAIPLVHSGVTIVKVHGDYLDIRIRNTEQELASYTPAIDALLDRLFDEYGLIICGWSAEWDVALRAAIERCPSRRYSTFWVTRAPLGGHAQKLARHRQATILAVRDADQFFCNLKEKVLTLADLSASHPLTTKIAGATVKRYVVDPTARIRLHDLIFESTEALVAELTSKDFPQDIILYKPEELANRLRLYESRCSNLLSLLTTGAYWGNPEHAKLWANSLSRLCGGIEGKGALNTPQDLRRYPILYLLYGAGIASTAAGHYQTLATLLVDAAAKDEHHRRRPICSSVHSLSIMQHDLARLLPNMAVFTPVSHYLCAVLREPLRNYIPGEYEYHMAFDRLEYMLAIVHHDERRDGQATEWWGPIGCFLWRGRLDPEQRVGPKIKEELESQGTNWGPIQAGLFGGSVDRAKRAIAVLDQYLSRIVV